MGSTQATGRQSDPRGPISYSPMPPGIARPVMRGRRGYYWWAQREAPSSPYLCQVLTDSRCFLPAPRGPLPRSAPRNTPHDRWTAHQIGEQNGHRQRRHVSAALCAQAARAPLPNACDADQRLARIGALKIVRLVESRDSNASTPPPEHSGRGNLGPSTAFRSQ